MSGDFWVLALTAANIGFFHTLFGPDHYLPFIVMSRARGWSKRKTLAVTALCGIGHVTGSVVLGVIGIAAGIAVGKLEVFEAYRGTIAAWVLIAFGLVYMMWGIKRALRGNRHTHNHSHEDKSRHSHEHSHDGGHLHVHENTDRKSLTPWVLFTIFVLGPCEPLIPILMYPAAAGTMAELIGVTLTFAFITITTMVTVVFVSISGLLKLRLSRLERYVHVVAGGTILAGGLAVQFLGL